MSYRLNNDLFEGIIPVVSVYQADFSRRKVSPTQHCRDALLNLEISGGWLLQITDLQPRIT